eukprot:1158904-Pelagomonas_calceolata.AAC.6
MAAYASTGYSTQTWICLRACTGYSPRTWMCLRACTGYSPQTWLPMQAQATHHKHGCASHRGLKAGCNDLDTNGSCDLLVVHELTLHPHLLHHLRVACTNICTTGQRDLLRNALWSMRASWGQQQSVALDQAFHAQPLACLYRLSRHMQHNITLRGEPLHNNSSLSGQPLCFLNIIVPC